MAPLSKGAADFIGAHIGGGDVWAEDDGALEPIDICPPSVLMSLPATSR